MACTVNRKRVYVTRLGSVRNMSSDHKLLQECVATPKRHQMRDAAYQRMPESERAAYWAKYYRMLDQRIAQCLKIHQRRDSWLSAYALSELYIIPGPTGGNYDEQLRKAYYYAAKAVRKNKHCYGAWRVMATVYCGACARAELLAAGCVSTKKIMSMLFGQTDKQRLPCKIRIDTDTLARQLDTYNRIRKDTPSALRFAERAVRCAARALAIRPDNANSRATMRSALSMRARQYYLLAHPDA